MLCTNFMLILYSFLNFVMHFVISQKMSRKLLVWVFLACFPLTITGCFYRSAGINTIKDLITCPSVTCVNPPNSFYFGYIMNSDQQAAVAACEDRCRQEAKCFSYTYITLSHPDYRWKGECMGRDDQRNDIHEEDEYAVSGDRISCGVIGVCNEGWFELNGSCYHLRDTDNMEDLLTWHQAHSWCLQKGADLATIDNLEDREKISNITDSRPYTGGLWIGLTRLADQRTYRWVDGDEGAFRNWAAGEPDGDSTGMCAFQLMHTTGAGCFNRSAGINTIKDLITCPSCVNPPNSFYFGYFMNSDQQAAVAACEDRCRQEAKCFSYTYITLSHPDFKWKGECMGRDEQRNDIHEEDEYAVSGDRISCGAVGLWYNANCGEKRGFICRKRPDSIPPTAPPPTETVPGYCPGGYFEAGGNKCFKIVSGSPQNGYSWSTALQLCRSGPGVTPDLASFQSKFENAIITMNILDHTWGYWIGLRQTDYDTSQWTWSDNQDTGFTNWAANKPSYGNAYKCGELWTNPGPTGTWNNLDCNDQRGYICQTYKDASSAIMTPPSTVAHSCKPNYLNYAGSCYRKLDSKMSWTAAEDACKNDGAALASIHSESENAALLVFGTGANPFWIGYHENSDGEWVWSDNWPATYSNFDSGEIPGTGKGCTSFKENGKWKDDDCSNSMNAVCKISTGSVPTTPPFIEGFCPDGWLTYSKYCYYFSSYSETYTSWESAKTACQMKAALHSSGSLVSIHSNDENEFIYDTLKKNSGKDSWIGLYNDSQALVHRWTDGTELQYTRWAPGEPNDVGGTQRCVEFYVNLWPGMWNDHMCSDGKGFVCKAEKVPAFTTPYVPPGVTCPTGCGWKSQGKYCYFFNSTARLSFNEAQESCIHVGGRYASLVMIPDAMTAIGIMDLMKEEGATYSNKYWIGLARKNENSLFKWLDGSMMNFTYWAKGEPNNQDNEHCVEIQSLDGMWNDMNCEKNKLPFICQIKKEDLTPPYQTSTARATGDVVHYVTPGGMGGIVLGTMLGTLVLAAIAVVILTIIRKDSTSWTSAWHFIRRDKPSSTAASGVSNPGFT